MDEYQDTGSVGVYDLNYCGGSVLCGSFHYFRFLDCRVCPLYWRRIQNYHAWGIRTQYYAVRVDLDKLALVSCGGGLG